MSALRYHGGSDDQAAIAGFHSAGMPAGEEDAVAAVRDHLGIVAGVPHPVDPPGGLAGAHVAAERVESLEHPFGRGVDIGGSSAQFDDLFG